MAAVVTPRRQPFGMLDESKLRNIQSLKNRQNSIPLSKPAVKRPHVTLDLSDSENVDPLDFQTSKKKRTLGSNEQCGPSRPAIKPFLKPRVRLSVSSVVAPQPQTPILNTNVKPEGPWSAPTAAGRSPTKSKRPGILSRRTRLNAPVLGGQNRSSLSLAAAVSGTLATSKQKRKIAEMDPDESKPESWFFNIFEFESPEEEEEARKDWVKVQVVDSLNISDELSYTSDEEENKENLPPNESFSVTTTKIPESRKDMMTDEPRTPLGDLNPSDYYADGLDAASVALAGEETVNTEEVSPLADSAVTTTTLPPAADFSFETEKPAAEEEEEMPKPMGLSEITRLLFNESAQPFGFGAGSSLAPGEHISPPVKKSEPAEIEIWESGSAKDEPTEPDSVHTVLFDL